MYMKIMLTCIECEYTDWGRKENELMNKIKMWNHVKEAHTTMAERIMKMYTTLPSNLYNTQTETV